MDGTVFVVVSVVVLSLSSFSSWNCCRLAVSFRCWIVGLLIFMALEMCFIWFRTVFLCCSTNVCMFACWYYYVKLNVLKLQRNICVCLLKRKGLFFLFCFVRSKTPCRVVDLCLSFSHIVLLWLCRVVSSFVYYCIVLLLPLLLRLLLLIHKCIIFAISSYTLSSSTFYCIVVFFFYFLLLYFWSVLIFFFAPYTNIIPIFIWYFFVKMAKKKKLKKTKQKCRENSIQFT